MRNTRKSGQRLRSKKRFRPTLRSGRGSRTNSNISRQIPVPVTEADKVEVSCKTVARRLRDFFTVAEPSRKSGLRFIAARGCVGVRRKPAARQRQPVTQHVNDIEASVATSAAGARRLQFTEAGSHWDYCARRPNISCCRVVLGESHQRRILGA
jgi:hypothetical protein